MGLKNFQEREVCLISVGVLGDICNAIESALGPYLEPLMKVLVDNCANDQARELERHIGRWMALTARQHRQLQQQGLVGE